MLERRDIIVTLLTGSLLGAWFGAGWATKLKSQTFYHVLAVLLVLIAIVLVLAHSPSAHAPGFESRVSLAIVGAIAGFGSESSRPSWEWRAVSSSFPPSFCSSGQT